MAGTKQVTLDSCEDTARESNAISKEEEFKKTHLAQDIAFPFEWKYGVITELSEEEKEAGILRGCDLCNQKKIEFQKVSAGIRSLLCRSCAENYVRDAIRLNTIF